MNVWIAFSSGLFIGVTAGVLIVALLHVSKQSEKAETITFDDDVIAFLFSVYDEVQRARKKHPGNKHLNVALMEEVGELAQAYLDGESLYRKRAEAMQVACVATRIALEGDGDFQS